MSAARTHVRVAELSSGDVLSASGATIVGAPSAGIATPQGCVDVLVRYPRQSEHELPVRRTWRRNTRVKIEPRS